MKQDALTNVADHLLKPLAVRMPDTRWLRREATLNTPEFDLAYVRSRPDGPPSGPPSVPAVIIPGGPGLASVFPYRGLRRQATKDGLDVIMVEHRGVGLSREDLTGEPLPRSAMWIDYVLDDIAAVLDAEQVDRVFVAGSSYGSYLASAFATKYPHRVEGLLLDSALQSTKDLSVERRSVRALFWDNETRVAELVRTLTFAGVDQRTLLDATRAAYELSGSTLVEKMLSRQVHNHRSMSWSALTTYARRDPSIAGIPGYYEFNIAGTIGFRELNYGAKPDGKPLDPALTYSLIADDIPKFEGEPYDLPAAAPHFDFPVGLLVGDRDLRTPPEIALRTATLAPHAALGTISNGHSALDTHPLAFEKALKLLVTGKIERLPELAPALSALPNRALTDPFVKAMGLLSGY